MLPCWILLWKSNSPAFLVKMPHPILIPSLSFAICKRRKMWIMMWLNWSFFPFSLRDRAKTWFLSLPKNSIDSWNKCKDAYISKYFPPAKIISLYIDIWILSNLIMNMLHNLGIEWNWWLEIVPLMAWVFGWLYKPPRWLEFHFSQYLGLRLRWNIHGNHVRRRYKTPRQYHAQLLSVAHCKVAC